MAEDLLSRARALFSDTPHPVSERAGNVNNFRSEVERRFGPVQRLLGQSVPGQQDLGIPNYDEYTQRRAAQQSLLDRARRLFGIEPSASHAGPVPPAGTPPAAPTPPRAGGNLGPSALAGLGALAQYLQQGPNPFGATLLPQIPGFSRNAPAPVSGYEMPETPRDISPIPEERGRDTGQNYGPARPQARPQGRAAQPQIDPRFAQLLQTILSQPQAPQAAPAPRAPAPRPGPGLILDPMMGGGNA